MDNGIPMDAAVSLLVSPSRGHRTGFSDEANTLHNHVKASKDRRPSASENSKVGIKLILRNKRSWPPLGDGLVYLVKHLLSISLLREVKPCSFDVGFNICMYQLNCSLQLI